jgi:biotin synthase-like enzyme
MSLQSEILQIINNNERLRASSLASKFNMDQINHINSIQTDEEFKVKALRAVGYGNCKHCEKYSQYQGKLKFYTYCSKDCIVSAARSARATKMIMFKHRR